MDYPLDIGNCPICKSEHKYTPEIRTVPVMNMLSAADFEHQQEPVKIRRTVILVCQRNNEEFQAVVTFKISQNETVDSIRVKNARNE